MATELIFGVSERELRTLLFDKIKEELASSRDFTSAGEKNIILVVPAQFTLSAEEGAFDALGGHGFFNLHIMSWAKLRSEILSETGGSGRTVISRIGRTLLLRKIVSGCGPEMKAFSSVCSEEAFLETASDFIVRCKQSGISTGNLEELAHKTSGLLSKKLSDMAEVTGLYEAAMAGRFTDSEDMLKLAWEHAPKSRLIRNSSIYFYGFYSFTPDELKFMQVLSENSRGVKVALLCGNSEVFNVTKKAAGLIMKADIGNGELPEYTGVKPPERALCVRCSNPGSMARTIASEICRLSREGMGFSDMAVLTDGNQLAEGSLKRELSALGVPLFMDEKRSVMHTPAMETVSAMLDLCCFDFKGRDIIRLVKTGITGAKAQEWEYFENYVNLYHINGSRLYSPLKYGQKALGQDIFDMCEAVRSGAADFIKPFAEEFCAAKTVREKALVLYSFLLEKGQFPERLSQEASLQQEQGYIESSQETLQLWETLCSLLDQMVELIGDEPADERQFRDMLTSSLSDIKLGILPQSQGRVLVGNISRTLLTEKKAVFVAGFNDGYIPSDRESYGILTEEEIAEISSRGFTLSKGSTILEQEELFCIRKNLSAAEKYLWLGYCLSDEEGNECRPSPLLSEIKEEWGIKAELADIDSDPGLSGYLQSRALASFKLPSLIRNAMSGGELSAEWKTAFNILGGESLKAGIFYTPEKKPLGPELAKDLYSKNREDLSLSPSRLDSFAGCPFKHFIDYGLRPMEERDFGLGGSEIGTVYHQALLELCNMLSGPSREMGIDITAPESLWMTVTEEELKALLEGILEKLSEDTLEGLMKAGAGEEYRSERILQVCFSFAKSLVNQVRKGSIKKMFFETGFSRTGKFPAIKINTPSGVVYVEGKIDRVDLMTGNSIKIVDYKSGGDRFSKALIEEGLRLQLMTYLEAACGGLGEAKPGGIFYYSIKSPDIAADLDTLVLAEAGKTADEVMEKIEKEYCLDGMIVDTKEALLGVDRELVSSDHSTVINLKKLKKDGSWQGNIISEAEMEEFRQKFMNNLSLAVSDLACGNISVKPARRKDYDACKYCEFKGICFRD